MFAGSLGLQIPSPHIKHLVLQIMCSSKIYLWEKYLYVKNQFIHNTDNLWLAFLSHPRFILFWCLVWISERILVTLSEDIRGFTQSLQTNVEIIPQLDYSWFLPNTFQFICHPTIQCYSYCHVTESDYSRFWVGNQIYCTLIHTIFSYK
jgi:hypothetical protein